MHAMKTYEGGNLVVALDPKDSVGIIDRYFPSSAFFTEFERFDRYVHKIQRSNQPLSFLSVCSPNYLHDTHVRFGLRNGIDVICEKPLVINPWNLDALAELEESCGKRVYNILQLRLHPSIINLQSQLSASPQKKKADIDLTYISARGKWYYASWKADASKSGTISTNIGIHFFDMLIALFGSVQESVVHVHSHDRAAGYLELDNARVRWFLSINAECLPENSREKNKTTYRSIKIDDEELEFSEGFTDLHTASYAKIIAGAGFGITEARPSIELVHAIRHSLPIGLKGDYHPLAALPQSAHPFSS